MRNIVEYPITYDELIETVDRALEHQRKLRTIGGIDGVALELVRIYLTSHKDDVQLFLGRD